MIRQSIPQIAIDTPELSGNTVRLRLHVSRPLRKYFLNDVSYVQYDGIDLKKVNNSILAIPLLSMIAPITWAVGANIHVAELDTSYLQCLAKVKDTYRSVHTNFSFSGDISAEKVITNKFDNPSRRLKEHMKDPKKSWAKTYQVHKVPLLESRKSAEGKIGKKTKGLVPQRLPKGKSWDI